VFCEEKNEELDSLSKPQTNNISRMNKKNFDHVTAFAILAVLIAVSFSVLRVFHDEYQPSSELPFSFQPELYHGEGKSHHFFEGWYHKLVRTTVDCGNNTIHQGGNEHSLSMAVVPGVFYDNGNNGTGKNESHAFIFVTINGEKQHYYRFDIDTEFQYRRYHGNLHNDRDYYVKIGNNTFSKYGMSLDLVPRRRMKVPNKGDESVSGDDDDSSISLKGSIEYENISPWPISPFNLGAMGPVGYFLSPFLECYHDVLSFDHTAKGTLLITNHGDYDKGYERVTSTKEDSHLEEFYDSECNDDGTKVSSRGYVEKDRGENFPKLWIWMQTNSFRKQSENLGTSLFFSVARIPILTTYLRKLLPKSWSELEFPGFTAAVWLNTAERNNDPTSKDDHDLSSGNTKKDSERLIPFATWTGAYFEDLTVDDERIVAVLNSGGIGGGFWGSMSTTRFDDAGRSMIIRGGRFVRAWIGSFFVNYDSAKLRYRLEIVADRRVPHVLLYAPKTTNIYDANDDKIVTTTSKMEPFVNEALNAKVHVRLFEYYLDDDGTEYKRLLLDDIGEQAGLEVHQNVQYLMDNVCGKVTANRFMCL